MATILVVEDNADDQALMLRALSAHQPVGEVVTASDGVEALRYLLPEGSAANEDGYELPAVVLLDLKLPRMDGLQVLRRIRADTRTRRVPVVILTSSDEESDIRTCYEQGANSYLRKPVDYREFVEVVARVKHYWLSLNESGH